MRLVPLVEASGESEDFAAGDPTGAPGEAEERLRAWVARGLRPGVTAPRKGTRRDPLFEASPERLVLELVDTEPLKSGRVILCYRPEGAS